MAVVHSLFLLAFNSQSKAVVLQLVSSCGTVAAEDNCIGVLRRK